METITREKELLVIYRDAKAHLEAQEEALKAARQIFEKAESMLIEAMNACQQEATAKYEGIGYCRMMKPRLYASYRKENEEAAKAFLIESGRSDLIKETVHPSSLSAYVAERLESGESIPEIFSYYLKPQLRLYA